MLASKWQEGIGLKAAQVDGLGGAGGGYLEAAMCDDLGVARGGGLEAARVVGLVGAGSGCLEAAMYDDLGVARGGGLEAARMVVMKAVRVVSWMQLSMVAWRGRGEAWRRCVSMA